MDNANPLFGWDISAVRATGKAHGADPADIYGCLFFHIKEELQKFATRIRDCNIDITITQYDSRDISHAIADGRLKPFGKNYFDRIETSNVADYVGIPQVLSDWGPLLNTRNSHSCLLMNFMNWCPEKDSIAMANIINRKNRQQVERLASIVVGFYSFTPTTSSPHIRETYRV